MLEETVFNGKTTAYMHSWKDFSNHAWIFDGWTITYSDLLFAIELHLSDISEDRK